VALGCNERAECIHVARERRRVRNRLIALAVAVPIAQLLRLLFR
jgi:hypothetical protein